MSSDCGKELTKKYDCLKDNNYYGNKVELNELEQVINGKKKVMGEDANYLYEKMLLSKGSNKINNYVIMK